MHTVRVVRVIDKKRHMSHKLPNTLVSNYELIAMAPPLACLCVFQIGAGIRNSERENVYVLRNLLHGRILLVTNSVDLPVILTCQIQCTLVLLVAC